MSDTTNQQINDVVAMLDGFMARGGGHMNVEFDDPSSTVKEVEELGCIDCAKNLACSVPTLMEGVDDLHTEEQQ